MNAGRFGINGQHLLGDLLRGLAPVLHLQHLLDSVVAGRVGEVVVDDGVHLVAWVFGRNQCRNNGIVVPNSWLKGYGLVFELVASRVVVAEGHDVVVDGALPHAEVRLSFDRLRLGRGVNPYHSSVFLG